MFDLHNNLKIIRAIEPKAIGTTGATNGSLSAVIDRQGYESVEFVYSHGTAGATGDTSHVVVLECDTSGGTYTSVADSDLRGTEAACGLPAEASARTSGVGKNVTRRLGYRGLKRYLKTRVYGLGHATGIVSAVAILGNPRKAPVAT